MKRLMVFFLVAILMVRINVLAYDCAFLSKEEFLLYENAHEGRWKWQLYAASDDIYIESDMYSDGKRYMSQDAINALPSGKNQMFYGVKTFYVPYTSEIVIEPGCGVSGEDTEKVKFKILKNDQALFPVDKEWCTAEELCCAPVISTDGKKDDVIRFVVAPYGEKPYNDFKIGWCPEIVLRTNGMFVKNAKLDIQGEDTVYRAAEGFCGIQGENGWIYKARRVRDGAEYAQEYYSSVDCAWKNASNNNRGQIGSDFMLPGIEPTTAFDVMRVFTAPDDGVVTIASDGKIEAFQKDIADDFGVKIRILHNGEKVYPRAADWEYIESRNEAVDFKSFSLQVKKGDLISFEAGRTINSEQAIKMRQNILRWNPKVIYEKTADVSFDLVNYSQESTSFYPIIATYNDGMLKSISVLDKVELSENEQVSRFLSVAFSDCTELKIFLLENMTDIKPCDNVTKLNEYVREVR